MTTSLLVAIVLDEDVICIKSICTERVVHFLDVTGSENPNVMRFIHETKPVSYEMNHNLETFDPSNKKTKDNRKAWGKKRQVQDCVHNYLKSEVTHPIEHDSTPRPDLS